jgi:hypothetical protein
MVKRRSLAHAALASAIGAPMAITAASAQQVDSAALLATLLKLEAESWQFLKDKDVAGAKDYLGDDALLIFADGTRFTKDEFLKAIPDIRLESITIAAGAEIKVWTQNVATLLYRVTYASAMKDAKATTTKAQSASTYARRNGKWLNVLYQETPTA